MLKSKKNVFWEALSVTIVIFIGGILVGFLMEEINSTKINQFYLESEISLTDASALSSLTQGSQYDCETIKKSNIDFANRVYEEAVLLEDYQYSSKLTKENMDILHRKYDLLRTLIWASNKESLKRCSNYNILIYLYESKDENIQIQAKQNVWSKILFEVKKENEDNVLLLPIAVDTNLTSLDLLISEFEIEKYPVIILNNNIVISELEDTSQIQELLIKD